MANSRLETGDPIDLVWSGDDHSVCPACDHERNSRGPAWETRLLARVFRFTPKTRCRYEESSAESISGMQGECGCTEVFHSS